MVEIRHWNPNRTLRVARSAGGVRVTTHPRDNLVMFGEVAAGAPEILQKCDGSLALSRRH